MSFDWPRFLTAHHIEWSDRGPSATKGNISTRCPWCGTADPSMHLAVSLEGKGYRCFRVRAALHSGKSVPRLIQALLQCSWDEACRLAGVSPSATEYVEDRDLGKRLTSLLASPRAAGADAATSAPLLQLLPEFRPLNETGAGRWFAEYLYYERNYTWNDITTLSTSFNLHYAIDGVFHHRLIFPIHMRGKLVNWTARSISRTNSLRYRTLSSDPEKAKENHLPVAPLSIEHTLFNHDRLTAGGRRLYIVEGPFDAMKLDYFGEPYGIRATATYTKSISDSQLALLEGLRDKFDELVRVLDADASLDMLGEQQRMAHLGVGAQRLPRGVKDPDNLTRQTALEFMRAA